MPIPMCAIPRLCLGKREPLAVLPDAPEHPTPDQLLLQPRALVHSTNTHTVVANRTKDASGSHAAHRAGSVSDTVYTQLCTVLSSIEARVEARRTRGAESQKLRY